MNPITTVLATGCFSHIHAGHVHLLKEAAQLGRLIVGINSARSIQRLKPWRVPIPDDVRAALLESIAGVSEVRLFSEQNPATLIRDLRPDIWVKGGDYTVQELARTTEGLAALEVGAKIVIIPWLPLKGEKEVILSECGRNIQSV